MSRTRQEPNDVGADSAKSRQARGVALCVASALSFAVLPFLGDAAFGAGVGLPELLLIRFTVATVALWLLVAIRRPALPSVRLVGVGLALGGIAYASQSALYFAALPYNGPGLNTLLLYTFPVVVFAFSVLRGRERASRLRLLALALALAGVAAVLLGDGSGNLRPIGVVLGLTTAVVYATYILLGDTIDSALDRILLSALVCTGATVTYTILNLVTGGPDLQFAPAGWWWAAALGLVATALALTLFFAGMRLVGAATASIVSCLEPVATVLLGIGLYGDRLGPMQLAGAAAVLSAVVLLQLRPRRYDSVGTGRSLAS